jgi:HD superfamily phosphohydrolase YqeK
MYQRLRQRNALAIVIPDDIKTRLTTGDTNTIHNRAATAWILLTVNGNNRAILAAIQNAMHTATRHQQLS